MWYAGIIVGIAAALIHLPIDERPVSRLAGRDKNEKMLN